MNVRGTAESGPPVRLRALRKQYGSRRALAGIDLELQDRQIVGVVGPDGAGKTTLLRSLAGLLEIEAEEALVLGFDLRGDVTELKRSIGYVPQAFSLQRDLSVIENLRFTARLHRIPTATFQRRVEQLLARTGLAPFAERQAGALSGGMKQKLSVTNALLPEPKLLVLDEATAGVDVLARAEIAEMLQREKSRALVVLSTSYLDEVASCDRLVYLDRGRVVASGAPDELRASVAVELYRAWGHDPRAIAHEARKLSYVDTARATGRFARIEVRTDDTPGEAAVIRELGTRTHALLIERMPVDMESALLALSRGSAGSA